MIDIQHLTYTYPATENPALQDFSLRIPKGAFVLISGLSGSGKSTLLRAINGLVPHFYGGKFSGRVRVDGLDTTLAQPRDLAEKVGFVFQDPSASFVMPTVEDELAFGMENLGVAANDMAERITRVLTAVDGHHLRHRQIETLSGGESQRIAIAAAMVLQPRLLILDEPTSQLDPSSAGALIDVLANLHQQHHITIILAEHRLARILPIATHWLALSSDQPPIFGSPADVLPQTDLHPPFIEAAKYLNWKPLPLSISEAREMDRHHPVTVAESPIPAKLPTQALLQVKNLTVSYDGVPVLKDFSFDLYSQECLAILGPNGVGKSTLLKALSGLITPEFGQILFSGSDITHHRIDQRAQHVAYVPQDPNTLLFANTLLDELNFTLRGLKLAPAMKPQQFLEALHLGQYSNRYPRDLSGGERQRAALAAMLIAPRPIILLDEPTMGLDYRQRHHLVDFLQKWRETGHSIIIATHDVELAARSADRIMILKEGKIEQLGVPREILLTTSGYQTQLAHIFGQSEILTTDDLPRISPSI
jgi:energy-coupling factor transport system ATP-binding protein